MKENPNLIERLKAETPKFHARNRNWSFILATVIAALILVKPSFIPVAVYDALKVADFVLVSLGIYAQTTVK